MTKTVKKRKVDMPSGIRHKMTAAISMLLISCIMLVSTTYAWFTLSTAPEVKGITTNVGANGNLEMMLLNNASYASAEDNLGVESDIGDSSAVQSVTEANVKWGNLVDLSSESYGLSSIALTPAKLNLPVTVGDDKTVKPGTTVGPSMLLAPSYGTDGRVIEVNTTTGTGRYEDQQWINDEEFAGVRAIGSGSGVTQRLSAYRLALNAIATKTSAASTAAKQSLSDNGQDLATILVAYMQDTNATFTRTDVEVLGRVLKTLKSANDTAGEAIKSAVLAYSLSSENTTELTDEQVTELQTAVNDATLENLNSVTNIKIPNGYDAAKTQWTANDTAVATAQGKYDTLMENDTKTSYTYAEIQEVVESILNKTHTKIGGIENAGKKDLEELVNNILASGAVEIVMLEGSGIYADLAELLGDYSVKGLKVKVTYNGLTVTPNVTMATEVIKDGKSPLVEQINRGSAPTSTGGEGQKTVLQDTYGYALDFGFRTNAAASDLQLQTAPSQRVYTDGKSEEVANTQGSGSVMTFTTANVNTFSLDEVRALMSAIRIAFVQPDAAGYTMLAIAAPAITSTTDPDTGITTYTGGEASTDGKSLTANINLYNYTQDADGYIQLGEMKADKTAITSLNQNVAKKITVIVFLDGNIVDNTMVANAKTSMTGSLNLQFSSSADLKPMENTKMREGGATAGNVTITYTSVAAENTEYTFGGVTGTVKAGYTIYQGNDNNYYYSTDGSSYTKITTENFSNAVAVTAP